MAVSPVGSHMPTPSRSEESRLLCRSMIKAGREAISCTMEFEMLILLTLCHLEELVQLGGPQI